MSPLPRFLNQEEGDYKGYPKKCSTVTAVSHQQPHKLVSKFQKASKKLICGRCWFKRLAQPPHLPKHPPTPSGPCQRLKKVKYKKKALNRPKHSPSGSDLAPVWPVSSSACKSAKSETFKNLGFKGLGVGLDYLGLPHGQ